MERGSYMEINRRVMKHLEGIITDWPGGEPPQQVKPDSP